MRQFGLAVLFGFFVLAPTYLYVYSVGMSDGVAHYKKSQQFALTLKSMYTFGVIDACIEPSTCHSIVGRKE